MSSRDVLLHKSVVFHNYIRIQMKSGVSLELKAPDGLGGVAAY